MPQGPGGSFFGIASTFKVKQNTTKKIATVLRLFRVYSKMAVWDSVEMNFTTASILVLVEYKSRVVSRWRISTAV
jgi:hypothetical protein